MECFSARLGLKKRQKKKKKHSKSTPWGTPSQVPKSTQKALHAIGALSGPGPWALLQMAAGIAGIASFQTDSGNLSCKEKQNLRTTGNLGCSTPAAVTAPCSETVARLPAATATVLCPLGSQQPYLQGLEDLGSFWEESHELEFGLEPPYAGALGPEIPQKILKKGLPKPSSQKGVKQVPTKSTRTRRKRVKICQKSVFGDFFGTFLTGRPGRPFGDFWGISGLGA